ncbi:hypothetical protein, partial [Pseudonocardia sp.]|uniref:hypothetical protein n=1 Tax=Pseudonocardia sp. TaxID=60912 RepID=UPI0031FC1F2E
MGSVVGPAVVVSGCVVGSAVASRVGVLVVVVGSAAGDVVTGAGTTGAGATGVLVTTTRARVVGAGARTATPAGAAAGAATSAGSSTLVSADAVLSPPSNGICSIGVCCPAARLTPTSASIAT